MRKYTEAELCKEIIYYLQHYFKKKVVPPKEQNYYLVTETFDMSDKGRLGAWSVPDFLAASVLHCRFIPNQLTLYSFEVKTFEGGDVSGVFQAAHHNKWAHYSYFVWHAPDSDHTKGFGGIKRACEKEKVGFIYFSNPRNHDDYKIEVEPARVSPAPINIESFISARFCSQDIKKIKEWYDIRIS